MSALVCDICGGKLIMGAGGIATCENCGMEHSVERMKEKVQEIKGTVRIDNSHMIENYLEIAKTAIDAGNNAEAESYCNKVIEIEPTNYKAWMLKGEAVAWESSIQNSRIDEGISSFIKGINNAPEEEKETLIEEAKEQIKNLSLATISLRADRFAKWPDKEESDGLISDLTSIANTFGTFFLQTGACISLNEIMAPVATQINQCVVKAWQNVILPDYKGKLDERPGKYEWEKFVNRINFCTTLLSTAISLCDEDDEDDIKRYENLIFLHKAAIESCSWDYRYSSWGKRWYKDWELSDEAKSKGRRLISQYETKIKEIKASIATKQAVEKTKREQIAREESKKKNYAYRTGHPEEKSASESEKMVVDLKSAKVGDYIRFGSYEQENDFSSGKEAIEWLVLASKDNRILVISSYGLDCEPYNVKRENVTWESSSLRKWLNEEFINEAFSDEEKAMIPTVTVSADENPNHSTNPGKETQDQVFLLSILEVKKYFTDISASCKPTSKAVAQGVYTNDDNGNGWWWLRSPGYGQKYAARVYSDGSVDCNGLSVHYDNHCVRPALWINLNS